MSLERMPRWLRKVIEFASSRNTQAQRILLTSAEILLDLLERNSDERYTDENSRLIKELILPNSRQEPFSPSAGQDEGNFCMEII